MAEKEQTFIDPKLQVKAGVQHNFPGAMAALSLNNAREEMKSVDVRPTVNTPFAQAQTVPGAQVDGLDL